MSNRDRNKNKFLRDLEIDKYNLDEELVRQPQLYMEWALAMTKASDEKDEARKDLDLTKAKAERKIRKHPKRFGVTDKLTDKIVKTLVILDREVRRYESLFLKASYNERVLAKVEKAFGYRKSSLEGLTRLDSRLHFSEPRTPTEYVEGRKQYHNETGSLIRKKLRKIKRR